MSQEISGNQIDKGDLTVCLNTGTNRPLINHTIIDRLLLRASDIQPVTAEGLTGFKVLDRMVTVTIIINKQIITKDEDGAWQQEPPCVDIMWVAGRAPRDAFVRGNCHGSCPPISPYTFSDSLTQS